MALSAISYEETERFGLSLSKGKNKKKKKVIKKMVKENTEHESDE